MAYLVYLTHQISTLIEGIGLINKLAYGALNYNMEVIEHAEIFLLPTHYSYFALYNKFLTGR